jgi:hypothetical protein
MIRFRITKNVILNTKPRRLPSYSMYTVVAKLPQGRESFYAPLSGFIVLEKPKQ